MKAGFLLMALSAAWLVGCVTSPERPLPRNAEIVRRYFDGWANHGDSAVADALIATNLVLHNPPLVVNGLAAYKQSMATFHAAFPDLHFTVVEELTAKDRVLVRWTLTGTQRGELQGHPASGKTVAITGMSLFRLAHGRIQEIWVNMDRLGFQTQLGWLSALKN